MACQFFDSPSILSFFSFLVFEAIKRKTLELLFFNESAIDLAIFLMLV